LSKEEVERMVREAEKYADQDRDARERVEAKNGMKNLKKIKGIM
jgi:molecular chaperone DnaK (HSP70)